MRMHPYARLPTRRSASAAGVGVSALEGIEQTSGEHTVVANGHSNAGPEGFEGQCESPSRHAAKRGISLVNAPGTKNRNYCDEIKCERIAMWMIAKAARSGVRETHVLDESERRDGGPGSTGA